MTGVRRMWIDLANAPHVLVCEPIVKQLREEGWEVLLTARDHAKTVELARRRWSEIEVVGGASPHGRIRKGRAIGERAANLVRFARSARPTAAFSHGSYAQIVAARACRIPSVTMMDYEHQPANHLSFRLARRVVVPAVFPAGALRRFGAANGKVRRYDGFKEELYLAGFAPNASILRDLGIDDAQVVAVFRTPPDGALYHHGVAGRFDELLGDAAEREGVAAVLLPRDEKQGARYRDLRGVLTPKLPLDSLSLLARADLVVGGGGTMTREAALLGTPTYTVFAGELGAVDAELIRRGLLRDLRAESLPAFVRKPNGGAGVPAARAEAILRVVSEAVDDAAR